ncbi:LysR family transcriptional regulator [Streptosporangium lutulentum]
MLDVVRLRVLAAVARNGSVTAAARELHYSQPSVSHHLAKLEAETGAKLIQKVGRGIRLTEAGLLLAERATEIIGRIDSAASELSAHVGLRAGRVGLAAFLGPGHVRAQGRRPAFREAPRPATAADRDRAARRPAHAPRGLRGRGGHLPL